MYSVDINKLTKEYQRLGFKRERHLLSLKKDGMLKAVVMVNISDMGLNLAGLTNCIKVVAIDSDGLTKDISHLMVSKLSKNKVMRGKTYIDVLVAKVKKVRIKIYSYIRIKIDILLQSFHYTIYLFLCIDDVLPRHFPLYIRCGAYLKLLMLLVQFIPYNLPNFIQQIWLSNI